MAEDPDQKVVLLQEVRDKRALTNIELALMEAKPIEPDLDLRGKKIAFSVAAIGATDLDNDHLRVIIHDASGEFVVPIGALSFTRKQFEELEHKCDPLLAALARRTGESSSS